MYIDRHDIEEYPFDGVFYTMSIDETKPLNEQKEEEVVLLETKCDIQESQKQMSGTITAVFEVFFPFDKEVGIDLKRGIQFKSTLYGLAIDGDVKAIIPTQMGGCVAYVVDKNV